jgi:hypothetical protein
MLYMLPAPHPLRQQRPFVIIAWLATLGCAGASFATRTDAAAALPAGLSCHARDGRDLSGDAAYVWGMNNIVGSAAECCALCAAHQQACGTKARPPAEYAPGKQCGRGRGRCNAWVYCAGSSTPGSEDRCFSYDIHKHRKGECWLKHESNITGPVAAGPTLPRAFREAQRSDWPWAVSDKVWPGDPPERLTWVSGIVAPIAAPAWKEPKQPGWYHRFCKKQPGGTCGPEPNDPVEPVKGRR